MRWVIVAPMFRRHSSALAWLLLCTWIAGPSQASATDAAERDESAASATEPAYGRFRPFRDPRGLRAAQGHTADEIAEMERLAAIGYVSGRIPSPGRSNVTIHDEAQVDAGLNFYTSGHGSEAFLTDMDGRVLHHWKVDFEQVWPHRPRFKNREFAQFIRRAHLFENGDLLAIWDSVGIARLDKDSNVLWANANMAHHDLQVMKDGRIFVLTARVHKLPRINPDQPVREDFVTVLDARGKTLKSVSLLEAFEHSDRYRSYWQDTGRVSGELFHTNTLEVLDGSVAGHSPAFQAGRILTSMLLLDTIAVVDLERPEVVWAHRGGFAQQHDPEILENGHLLLFDNADESTDESASKGEEKSADSDDRSRVEEYAPEDMELVWSYAGSGRDPFYSRTCGSAQRLPGGNTLITESDGGRAFEVTPAGEIVWEFYNPHLAGENEEWIAVILELQRLPRDFPISWASGAAPTPDAPTSTEQRATRPGPP
jgi:hypothetical protein